MFEFKNNQNSKSKFEYPIFRASYADATDQITQLFYIKDFTKVLKKKKNYLEIFDTEKLNEDLSNVCSSQESIENLDLS